MNPSKPVILVIIGITGDLAKRKLLPAIEAIAKSAVLPEQFRIIGTSRHTGIAADAIASTKDSFVREHLEIVTLDTEQKDAYEALKAHLASMETEFGAPAQRLFYVSVPPAAARGIIELLGTSGLAEVPHTKLLLEKPFGTDLASATELVAHIEKSFANDQVYRIDHYLAKHMVQNLVVFRSMNSLFRRTWNNQFIERIEIIAHEAIGIEGRARFYEQTGALRDLVQSHLLQLAALTLMSVHGGSIPERRHKALSALSVRGTARRGQYAGYRAEVGNEASTVETFAALTLESSDPQFAGVPITLVTGKCLPEKRTEVRIFYTKEHAEEADELILRVQPNEGVTMKLWAKRPGYENTCEERSLEFTYSDHYATVPDAYEQVLVDVISGDHDLFVSSEEVLESWRIIEPVLEEWRKGGEGLVRYQSGTMPAVTLA